MQTRNSTFKLSEETLDLLRELAADMGTSRTEAIRIALRELHKLRADRRATAEAFIGRVLQSVPQGSTLMIGLDSRLEPYATLNGQDPRNDIQVAGRHVTSGHEDFVQVFLLDADSGLKLAVGAIQAGSGGWLALLDPLPVQLA